MKEWWDNLALREKKIIIYGGALLILFLLYEIVWSPFTNKVDSLRKSVTQNQALLIWMQNADQRLQSIVNTQKNKTTTNESLLSIMQREVNKSPLATHVTQLRQAENDSVQLTLQKADFDRLIALLTDLSNQDGLTVSQFTATATGVPGEVMADVTIKQSV